MHSTSHSGKLHIITIIIINPKEIFIIFLLQHTCECIMSMYRYAYIIFTTGAQFPRQLNWQMQQAEFQNQLYPAQWPVILLYGKPNIKWRCPQVWRWAQQLIKTLLTKCSIRIKCVVCAQSGRLHMLGVLLMLLLLLLSTIGEQQAMHLLVESAESFVPGISGRARIARSIFIASAAPNQPTVSSLRLPMQCVVRTTDMYVFACTNGQRHISSTMLAEFTTKGSHRHNKWPLAQRKTGPLGCCCIRAYGRRRRVIRWAGSVHRAGRRRTMGDNTHWSCGINAPACQSSARNRRVGREEQIMNPIANHTLCVCVVPDRIHLFQAIFLMDSENRLKMWVEMVSSGSVSLDSHVRHF